MKMLPQVALGIGIVFCLVLFFFAATGLSGFLGDKWNIPVCEDACFEQGADGRQIKGECWCNRVCDGKPAFKINLTP